MDDTHESPPSEAPGAPAAPAPRGLGTLLSDSLDMGFERIGSYVGVVALGVVPGLVLVGLAMNLLGFSGEASVKAAVEAGQYGEVAWLLGLSLIGLAFKGLAYIALSLMLIARADGRELGLADAFGESLSYLGPLLAAYALVGLWVLGGLILLIIPGVILAIRYSLTHWAVLIEHERGSAALARSRQIVVAHMGKVVGNLLVAGLLVALVSGTVIFGLYLALALAGLNSPGPQALVHNMILDLTRELVQGTVGVWSVAFAVLLYKDLAVLHPKELS